MSTTAIYSLLISDATYNGLSSGGIYSYMAKTGIQQPYTIIYPDDSESTRTQGNPASQEWRDVVVACYAPTTVEAKAMSNRARVVLDNYIGTSGGVQVKQMKYQGVDDEDYDRELKRGVVETRYRMCVVL